MIKRNSVDVIWKICFQLPEFLVYSQILHVLNRPRENTLVLAGQGTVSFLEISLIFCQTPYKIALFQLSDFYVNISINEANR